MAIIEDIRDKFIGGNKMDMDYDIYSETNEYWTDEFNKDPITQEDLDRQFNHLYQ